MLANSSSSDSFYSISIESNSIEDNNSNRSIQPNIRILYKITTCFIVVLVFTLLAYVIYNYCYEIKRGLNTVL